jgi:hypothetical protein
MGHNASVVLLGGKGSNIVDITNETGDPATFKAGLAVRRATTGALQLADDAVAPLIGVSLGPSLDETKKTAVARTGNFIPIRLKNDAAGVKIGDITFTSKLFGVLGNAVSITLADTGTGDTAIVTVVDNAISVAIDGGTTTTTTIKTAIDAHVEASKLVSVAIDGGDEAATVSPATITLLTGGSDYAVPGTVVKIDDVSGEASVDGDATAATYISGTLTGIDAADNSEVPAAYISLPGGF